MSWRSIFNLGWYGQPCTNNETVKITATPYLAGTVNYATKYNTMEITVATYLAGTVNDATMDATAKITDY